MADFNLPNTNFQIPSDNNVSIKIDENAVQRTLKKLAAPVFDFFTKTEEPQEQEIVDYDEAITRVEMSSATIQRILNESDPNVKRTINIVI